jgi:hypothetical protein
MAFFMLMWIPKFYIRPFPHPELLSGTDFELDSKWWAGANAYTGGLPRSCCWAQPATSQPHSGLRPLASPCGHCSRQHWQPGPAKGSPPAAHPNRRPCDPRCRPSAVARHEGAGGAGAPQFRHTGGSRGAGAGAGLPGLCREAHLQQPDHRQLLLPLPGGGRAARLPGVLLWPCRASLPEPG